MRFRALTVAIAVIGAFVAVTATPTSAQQAATLVGDFECTSPGTFTVSWTIENIIGADGTVGTATLSGAAEGTVSFSPNPFTGADAVITGSSLVSGDTVGTVTLNVTVTFTVKGSFDVPLTADVVLDGSCEAPPSTEPPTTEAPTTTAAVAATAAPRFTG